MSGEFLSLPPGRWGPKACRIAVVARSDTFVVLDRPHPPAEVHRSTEASARAFEQALRAQREESPAAARILREPPHAIYHPECGGPVVFALGRQACARLREEYGSFRWEFRFLLLVRQAPPESRLACDLPVALHRSEPRSLVSHRSGKKASTVFQRIGGSEGIQLWQAETSYLRPDQIRLHAAECGLGVAGENLYGQTPPLSRADLPGKRRPGGARHVLLDGPALHLIHLRAPSLAPEPFPSEPPKAFAKWLRLKAAGSRFYPRSEA